MRLIYRPIDVWPGELTTSRSGSPFEANWQSTLEILDRELHALGASECVVQLAVPESSIRMDGTLRGDRRPPEHPGVILSFETRRHGPLRYACDRFSGRSYRGMQEPWRHNVRAIALGLEALRKVERYGIGQRGEQYVGWKAIGAGTPMPPAAMSFEDAARFLAEHSKWPEAEFVDPAGYGFDSIVRDAYRDAAKKLHPDAGGDAELFKRLGEARDLLLEASS